MNAAVSEHPRLSIVIASYRCREFLSACLDSLALDRVAREGQVVVVDNNSCDGTAELVTERFPWVELVAASENFGFAKANNLGIAKTMGRFVLLLNPDTIVPPNSLGAAVCALESQPDVGMLGVKLMLENGQLDHACKRGFPTPLNSLYYFLGLSRCRRIGRKFAQYTAGSVGEDDFAPVDAINGAFMLVRREALDDVGPLDEDYWLYGEDLDWCFRFWAAGWKILYWPQVSVLHFKGGSSGKNRTWRANHAFHRGMWLFYTKHYRAERPSFLAAAVWFGICTRLLLTAGVSSWVRAAGYLRRHSRTTGDALSG